MPDGIPFPDWFLNHPSEHYGKAIYGTGMYAMEFGEDLLAAQQVAINQAINEIVHELIGSNIGSVIPKTESIKIPELELRDILNDERNGAKVEKMELRVYKKQILLFVLVKITHEIITKKFRETAQRKFEKNN